MIDQLIANINHLAPRDRSFADSLVKQYNDRGTLSAKQWPYVFTLAERALAAKDKPAAPANPSLPDVGKIKSVFEQAKSRGWNVDLGMRFLSKDDRKVKISPAKSYSHNAGCYYVKVDGTYVGKITTGGEFVVSRDADAQPLADVAVEAVTHYLTDPVAAATAYGKKLISCCFCGRKLDTKESRHVGYGPICADRFGLPWGETGEKETRAIKVGG